MIIAAVILLLALIVLPSFWVKRQLKRYAIDRADLNGTGAELAEYLITQLKLEGVTVQQDRSDFYQPSDKTVHLSEQIYHGRSVTALAVSAHEVGHAIQHQQQQPLFMWRQNIALTALRAEKIAVWILMLWPVIGIFSRSVLLSLIMIAIAAGSFLIGVIAQLIVLPVEWDASFNKALPLIQSMQLLPESDHKAVKSILRAAALTYVAASLIKIVNVGRWLTILRR